MRTKFLLLVAAVAAVGSIAAAPAAGFCYDLDVNVNGDAVVDEAGCLEEPALP